jgi:hypothetical protein
MWQDIGTAVIGVGLFVLWIIGRYTFFAVADFVGPVATAVLVVIYGIGSWQYGKWRRKRTREALGLPPRP